MILGVLGSLLLMVFAIQIPFTGAFFHTTSLTIHDWSVALATSIIIFVAVEIWKALNLWREKRKKIFYSMHLISKKYENNSTTY